MRQLAIVSCVLLAVSLAASADGRIAHAAGTTPIESVPISKSNDVPTLSPSNPGHMGSFTLDHGLQFKWDGTIQLNLGGAYTEFDGTAYSDSGSQGRLVLVFQDVSTPASGVKDLFTTPTLGNGVNGAQQVPLKINVRGVKTLLITLNGVGCCGAPLADLVGSFMGAPPRYAPPRYVVVSYPSPGAVIPAKTSVVLLWHSFPGATAYLLHVWLVKQSGTMAIGPATPVFLSQLILRHTSYTWNDKGFLPGTYQYDLLPLDRYGNALAGRSPAIQFTVFQTS